MFILRNYINDSFNLFNIMYKIHCIYIHVDSVDKRVIIY